MNIVSKFIVAPISEVIFIGSFTTLPLVHEQFMVSVLQACVICGCMMMLAAI